MISREDIEAFKEDNMGSFKRTILAVEDDLRSTARAAYPGPALGLEKRIQPALDLMAKLPVDSYLIGGALRDTVNGREIRDFDIYVGPNFTDDMIEGATILTDGQEYLGQVAWGQCNFDRKLSRVLELVENASPAIFSDIIMHERAPAFQIMVLKEMFATPDEAARSVDFGICQIAYNLKTGLYCTPDFFRDCINRTFTFFPGGRSENDRLRSIARFERISRDKYHGYTPVNLDKPIA